MNAAATPFGHFVASLAAKARLITAFGVGLVAGAVAAIRGPWEFTVLVGWDATALCSLLMAWGVIVRANAEITRSIATRADDSRAAVDIVVLLGSVISLVGVVAGLAHTHGEFTLLTTLALVTIVLSWLLVHTTYAMRYARLYYEAPVGGVEFPGGEDPDYSDFIYVALSVGMTFQISDTNVTSREIRRAVSRHALTSYLFGTVIIGVTINVVGSLVG